MAVIEAQQLRQVRLLIADTDPDNELLSDDDVLDFIALEGHVKLAAASALDAIASSEALVSKVIRTQDLSTDGAKTADALRKHAASLRAQVDAERAELDDADSAFAVVPFGRPGVELAQG